MTSQTIFRSLFCLLTSSLLLVSISASNLLACPLVEGLIDYNCNGKIKIMATGDSVVKGFRDEENRGGWVGRLGENLGPNVEVSNVGVNGTFAGRLLRQFRRNIDVGITNKLVRNADVVILDMGRNSFYKPRITALKEVRNIKRLAEFLREKVGSRLNAEPFIVIATEIPVGRGFQRGWIREINANILRMNSKTFPVLFRFDRLPESILSEDLLHPDARGYSIIAKKATAIVRKKLQKRMLKVVKDKDMDGVYDHVEVSRFGTDPLLFDTDLDGLSDGAEILTHETDPLKIDTDEDGKTDGAEVIAGSDPLDPTL